MNVPLPCTSVSAMGRFAGYWMMKDVLARRGWTRDAVDRFLGDPDQTRRVGWAWAKLYAESRVAMAEASPEWRAWLNANEALLVRYDRRARELAEASTPEAVARRAAEAAAATKREDAERYAALQRAISEYMSANPGIAGAVAALHFINRLAKYRPPEQTTIYNSKNAFLRAAVEAGVARVYTFTHYESRWFIVEFEGGMRFHQPAASAPPDWLAKATPTDSHDPKQPRREVPSIGVTWEVAARVVDRATAELRARAQGSDQHLRREAGVEVEQDLAV